VSSTLGTIFKITTFGESHGPGVGVVIEGCPPGLRLDADGIQRELDRRKPGQNLLTTQRKEADEFEILSGAYEGRTLGSPLTFLIRNKDMKGGDYKKWEHLYRPSHADFTYDAKYGFRTPLGGGRASARETIGRVAAGAIAAQILKEELGVETVAWVEEVGGFSAGLYDSPPASRQDVDRFPARCPDEQAAGRMAEMIDEARRSGDSLGGVVAAVSRNVPPGLGDPVFGKLEADLARACLSIPACKGFESGSGFAGTRLRGSEHNDEFLPEEESPNTVLEGRDHDSVPRPVTRTNNSGGIQGGISNGMPLLMRLAFKPTATINREQNTVDDLGRAALIKTGGRHDPCVLPRAVPIVEAMINLTLVDAFLRQRALAPEWSRRFIKGGHPS